MIKSKDLDVFINGREALIPLTWDNNLVELTIYTSGIGLTLLKPDIDGIVQISGMVYNLDKYNFPHLFGLAPELTKELKHKVVPAKNFNYQGINITYQNNNWYTPDNVPLVANKNLVLTYNYLLDGILRYCIRKTKKVAGMKKYQNKFNNLLDKH